MSVFFFLVHFVTLIAFIVFWWKKRKARIAAGENYKEDSQYRHISKIKRIIGVVCVLSIILSGFTANPEEVAQRQAQKQAEQQAKDQADKAAKEQEIIEKVAALTGEDKAMYDAKFNEYKATLSDSEARAKAFKEVEAAINAREAAAKEAAEKAEKIEKSMTTGWDTSESSSQKNFEKAVHLIKGNSDYILNKEAISPDPGEALRKPWNFYGKIVTFTGVVTDSNQAPPGHSVAKALGGKYTAGAMQCGDIPIGFHVMADSDRLPEGAQVTIKGFIVGLDDGLTNGWGDKIKGIEFVGLVP